ncbi:MAG TPA: tetratricopeptide repeat protein, partial [Acidobacteriaceae bacterium]
MSRRGLNEDALQILSTRKVSDSDPEEKVHQLALKAMVLTDLARYPEAYSVLSDADRMCSGVKHAACADVLLAHGLLELDNERLSKAKGFLLRSLAESRAHGSRVSEVVSLSNLAVVALHQEYFDEALSWLRPSYQIALELGDEDHAQTIVGNEGWAYFSLGDPDRALMLFTEAGEKARRIGNRRDQLAWLITSGDVYSSKGLLVQAERSYRQALELGRGLKSEENIVNTAMDLAEVYVEAGRLDEADRYAKEALQLSQKSGNRLDILYSHLIQGQIALKRHDWNRASGLLREVEAAPESQTSMKWASELAMARLYEAQGQVGAAEKEYQTALGTFEGARAELKSADSQLPFVANATRIYDDYIHFLIGQGKVEEALMAADQSRARTLLQGLGIAAGQAGGGAARVDLKISPAAVARKAKATLLFYWLGEKQSYLWVVTPGRTKEGASQGGVKLFTLPARAEIERRIERYRGALMGPEDPLEAGNADGRALYAALVGPAAEMIEAKLPVMVLADGALCQLNFATLIAPATEKAPVHYWIEDATVISAPSLAMLAAAQPAKAAKGGRLLLMGDAISPDANYPQLAYAATEMQEIEKHFAAAERVVYAREQAAPEAYLKSEPRQFAYIHFVSHGVASQTDPLDSAIILSKGGLSSGGHLKSGLAKGAASSGELSKAGLSASEVPREDALRDGLA